MEEEEDNPGLIKFCMIEYEGGLLLRGIKIQPTSLFNERTDAHQE